VDTYATNEYGTIELVAHFKQLKRRDKMHLNQNIKLVNKLNEANHDYNTLRRRAVLRKAYRAKKQEVENERHVGMAELNKAYKRSMRERITESCVWILVGVVITLWLH
jgi:hypothetical protein